MNRRDFIRGVSASAASMALAQGAHGCRSSAVPAFAEGAEDMGPILTDSEICRSPALAGKRKCSYFCDDAIWALRDVTRHAQRSLFDHPFFSVLRECHDKYGLTAQINLFYRTDFFYGMDEFTLADVTDAYREEFRANADWLKLGFHSLQEFPDYPWINANYGDVKKLFEMIRSEVVRFAGEESFAYACVPHWCPMSKDAILLMKVLVLEFPSWLVETNLTGNHGVACSILDLGQWVKDLVLL